MSTPLHSTELRSGRYDILIPLDGPRMRRFVSRLEADLKQLEARWAHVAAPIDARAARPFRRPRKPK